MSTDVGALVAQERIAVARLEGQVQALAREGKSRQERLVVLEAEQRNYELAQNLLTVLSQQRTESALRLLEELATAGLRAVFGEDLALRIELKQSGRTQSADITVVSGGLETGVMDARGGGVAAVAGLMLRIAVLLMTPTLRRTLVLDETVAQLSEDYEPALSEFLRDLCAKTGLQIIMVTHSRALADSADQVVSVSQQAGASRLAEVGAER